jgi:hypothetical protein
MKNWVLLTISLLLSISEVNGQGCEYGQVIDTADVYRVNYMPMDTTLLEGDNFVFFIEMIWGVTSSYRFENHNDSIVVTKISRRSIEKKVVKGELHEALMDNCILYFGAANRPNDKLSMMIFKNNETFFQIIPIGSNINEVLACIKNYDSSIHKLVMQVLELKRVIDKKED